MNLRLILRSKWNLISPLMLTIDIDFKIWWLKLEPGNKLTGYFALNSCDVSNFFAKWQKCQSVKGLWRKVISKSLLKCGSTFLWNRVDHSFGDLWQIPPILSNHKQVETTSDQSSECWLPPYLFLRLRFIYSKCHETYILLTLICCEPW